MAWESDAKRRDREAFIASADHHGLLNEIQLAAEQGDLAEVIRLVREARQWS